MVDTVISLVYILSSLVDIFSRFSCLADILSCLEWKHKSVQM